MMDFNDWNYKNMVSIEDSERIQPSNVGLNQPKWGWLTNKSSRLIIPKYKRTESCPVLSVLVLLQDAAAAVPSNPSGGLPACRECSRLGTPTVRSKKLLRWLDGCALVPRNGIDDHDADADADADDDDDDDDGDDEDSRRRDLLVISSNVHDPCLLTNFQTKRH